MLRTDHVLPFMEGLLFSPFPPSASFFRTPAVELIVERLIAILRYDSCNSFELNCIHRCYSEQLYCFSHGQATFLLAYKLNTVRRPSAV